MIRKIVFVMLIIFSPFTRAGYPEARDNYINDFAFVIDNYEQTELQKKLHDFENHSGVEIVVVTIHGFRDYRTSASTWEQFATGLFNKWDIGNRSKNDGVMILVSKADRKIRIELGSDYPRHYDAMMKKIIDDTMVPELKNDNYTIGIVRGTEAVIDATTVKISFFEYYKWVILAGLGALMSTFVALYAKSKGKVSYFIFFFGLVGFL